MKIKRKFTKPDIEVFDTVQWTRRSSRITNLDGTTVFEMKDAEVPVSWSQLATDIMVSKYFRKAGVPQQDEDGNILKNAKGHVETGPERSARQVIARMAGCWRHWGEKHGYFDSTEDGQAFYDELCWMLIHQLAAPNSPQWFNTGLNWAYGISGPAQGHWITEPETGETKLAEDAYSHPQPHACFIQSVDDDLVNPGGIMDLWVREARLFKYGSGTGTNFSSLRGETEPLSGGGKSSGLMSWLKIGDRAAGAIKSGGTTRRAAKMVCLDLDHPDIENFINWKAREELKVAALVEGRKHLSDEQKKTADKIGLELDYDFNGESYQTVSGQNSNNSVRISNDFFKSLDENGDWELIRRTDGKLATRLPAHRLWDQLCHAAWQCADPGVQFDTTINQWHTCPASGRINASNPCSEYMFLDNTACNLASLNLLKFYDAEARTFDIESFEHAVRLWTIVLEISVLMASFPSKAIARLSYEYRTLGLGYANLGALLMQASIAYDSPTARAINGALTAILTGWAYATSAEMAAQLGPYPGYFKNREHMLRVIRNHRRTAYGVPHEPDEVARHEVDDYEGLEIRPMPIEGQFLENPAEGTPGIANSNELLVRARACWDEALGLGQQYGYRNAQTTVIAPTGTIGLLMDCDTTGVEPDFALVKFKKLAGGGYFKIANQSLKPALVNLGYDEQQVKDILTYVMGILNLNVPVPRIDGTGIDTEHATFADLLLARGLNKKDLEQITETLPSVFELPHAFTVGTLGLDKIERLGLTDHTTRGEIDVLTSLGLTRDQIEALNIAICGTQTIEGAPHLNDRHLPIFDCANTCGRNGKRFISVEGHIRMMAAAQPFISGAISKTINLPKNATVDDIKSAYRLSWDLGLKANALYRDGCKLSQPLNTVMEDNEAEDEGGTEEAKHEIVAEVTGLAKQIAEARDDAVPVEKVVERIIERPMRQRLPNTRESLTHKFNVAGHEGYLTVGLYPDDGRPGELFITMAKEGSTIGGLMDSLGTAISVALQYGVPVESLVNKFTHQRFEPAGMTHNEDIPFAKSLVDYIFRWLGMQFIPGYRAANAPNRTSRKNQTPGTAPLEHSTDRPKTQATADSHPVGSVEDKNRGNGGNRSNREHGRQFVDRYAANDIHKDIAIADPPRRGHNTGSDVSPNTEEGDGQTGTGNGEGEKTHDEHHATITAAMKELQADAPACDICGTITVRSGTCYKCLNCGNSMGCS